MELDEQIAVGDLRFLITKIKETGNKFLWRYELRRTVGEPVLVTARGNNRHCNTKVRQAAAELAKIETIRKGALE